MQGSRPERVAEQIRQEVSQMLATEVRDPGVGLVTLTRVKVSPDLQVARIYYTQMGDEKEQKQTAKALERASPFLRRQLGARLTLRRVPELHFHFDKSVGHQDRIERVLLELEAERQERAAAAGAAPSNSSGDAGDEDAS